MLRSVQSRFVRAVLVTALLLTVFLPSVHAQQWTYTSHAGPVGGGALIDGNGQSAQLYGVELLVNPEGTYVYIGGGASLRRYDVATGEITSLAGYPYTTGTQDGTEAIARFGQMVQMSFDANGSIVISEGTTQIIRRVTPAGVVTRVAGITTLPVPVCQNSTPLNSGFYNPTGIAVDKNTNAIYVVDQYTHSIRKITSTAVTTFAGLCASPGQADGTTAARFNYPRTAAIDASGNVFVTDTQYNFLRKITPAGVVSTVIGTLPFGGGVGYRDGAGGQALFESLDDLAFAPNGDLYITDSRNHAIRKYANGVVSTVASSAAGGLTDGPVGTATLNLPYAITIDAAGTVYFTDSGTLRRLQNGVVTTLAGSHSMAGAVNGSATVARFNSPRAATVDAAGNVYVTDGLNGAVRKITPNGDVTTFGGILGTPGQVDGPAGTGRLALAEAIAIDSLGNVYNGEYSMIRKIAPDGTISTLAGGTSTGYVDGPGATARFNNIGALCTGPSDEIYVADMNNNRVRKVLPDGTVSTLAGTATLGYQDGPGATARFQYPSGCAWTGGFLYVTDLYNYRIRRIAADGTVSTVAGNGIQGTVDAGTGTSASFNSPWGMAADGSGRLFVYEWGSGKVRMVNTTSSFSTVTIGPGNSSNDDGTFNFGGTNSWHSVASDANANLFFTSATGNYVRKASIAIADAPAIDATSGPIGVARQLSTTGTAATSWQWQIVRRPMLSSPASAALSNPTIPNPTFTPDAAGLYRIRLLASGPTGMSGRIVDFTATCGTVPTPAITITSGTSPTCANGSVTLDAGAGYTSYLWSTGATTRTITVTPASTTTYTVRGYDGICASAQASQTVTVYTAPTATVALTGANAVCPNGLGGTATVTNGGGPVSGQQWVWRSGAGSFNNIPGQIGTSYAVSGSDFPGPGSYTIAVRSTPSCGGPVVTSNEIAITVYTPQAGTVTASGPTTFCAGGSVTLTAPASPAYLWSTGATTQAITVDASGSYSVTVTDPNGCTATTSPTVVTVNNPPATPTITPSGPTTFCEGQSVTLTSSAASSWLWSNGATTQSIVVETAGSYTVTATNAAGCSTTSAPTAVTVNAIPSTPDVTASGPTTFCAGGSVTLTAPDGFTYAWSNGATSRSITVSEAGIYNVTVTNANGCAATSGGTIVTVNGAPTAAITASGPTTFCAGGSVTLTASAGASWLWSNGATTQSIVADTTGSYSVTVTNTNGCSATSASTAVTANALPATPVITASGPTTFCAGGSVTLTAPAGYTYAWSNGATTGSITVSSAGSYSVTVTDGNGCSSAGAPTTVVVNPNPTVDINVHQVYDSPGSGSIISNNGDVVEVCGDPTIRLVPTVLNPANTYQWSTGATTAILDIQATGTYTLTMTNANGCTATSSVTVNYTASPAKPVISASSTALCPGGSGVTLTAPAASSWLWSNGATTQSIVATQPGSYTVRVWNGACESPVSDPVTLADRQVVITPSGPTTFCDGYVVTLFANTGNSWLWSNGATTQSIMVSEGGSYTVTATFAEGCTVTSAPITLSKVTAAITADRTAVCPGGAIELDSTVSGGSNYSYQWYDQTYAPISGATYPQLTFAPAQSGFVYLKVTDPAAGCQATSNVIQFTVQQAIDATITAADSVCETSSGIASVPDAGPNATYQWSITNGLINGGNGSIYAQAYFTPTGTAPMTLTVTVTNPGCSVTTSKIITVNPSPDATISAGGPTTFCEGGSVTLTAPAGSTYGWSTGATTQSINVTASGTYYVTVTSAAGCATSSAPMTVTVNPLPSTPAITAGGPTTFCEGGSVTLTAPAGFSYLWSTGATTQSINVTASGSYSVTVTNASGCSATSAATSVTVNAPPSTPAITAGGPTTFCEGGSVTLSAPAGFSYLWSTGATTQAISATATGSYSVTVTNASGCSATSAATSVTVNPLPSTQAISAGGPTSFCEGGSVTLTAPAGYSYLWSNGATTQSIAVTASGSYSVSVTNANGCSATSAATSVTVNAPPSTPAITAGGPTTFCEGGSVTLTAPAGFSYLWSNGATTQSINATASGSYSLTVTNANGCSATSAATAVTVNAAPSTPAITAGDPTTFCEGGSVTLTAPAGFSYLWSTGATTQSINAAASGNYSVTVTNANGCSATSAATSVTVNPPPSTPAITAVGPTTFCEGGSVTLTAPAGFSYLWSNGATTQSINVSTSGSFTVIVTNANGCSATSAATSVTVNPPPAVPTITAGGPTTFCEGGSVTLTAPAGFSYLWSNGATTQSIDATATGNYSVTITNGNGCSATSAATSVTVNPPPSTPAITPNGPTTFCQGGTVRLTAPAGSSSYLWSNGSTAQFIDVTSSGNYTVTVTNANGCSATSAATAVTVNTPPAAPAITPNGPTTFCQGGTVRLTAPAGFNSYLWSNGATAQFIDVAATGNYTVTVTDANGCSAVSAATAVTVNTPPAAPSISANGPTTFCQGGTVRLTAPAGFSAYLWSNGSTAQFIDVTATGNYTVQVTNASGCTATSAATAVTVNPAPATPTITPNGPTTFCQGGTVRLTAPAGFASYLWSNGSTAQFIDVVATGSFTVQVTNANGCSAASAATAVTVNPLPAEPVISPANPSVCPNDSVTLTAPAGYASYLWSNGATTQSIAVPWAAANASFTVTVTNANGCSRISAATFVTKNAATVITTQPQNHTMPRYVTHTLTVSATGTPNLQYQWYLGNVGDTSRPQGTNQPSLEIGPFTKKGVSRYWVRVWSSGCPSSSVNSTAAVITVN